VPIPIVRTDGKSFATGATLTPQRMLQDAKLLREAKTDVTRRAEAALGLGNSLYFYVGHACPEFGQIVLVYDPTWTETERGSATPFDTGGLYGGFIKGSGTEDPVPYFTRFRVGLASWRKQLGEYVERHFASKRGYVLGDRAVADDSTGRLLHPDNHRRAWTWELQIENDHELLDGLLLLCVQSEVAEALRRELRRLPDDRATLWYELFRSPRFRVAPAAAEAPIVCAMTEEAISTWL